MQATFRWHQESLRTGTVVLHLAGEIDLAVQSTLEAAIDRSLAEGARALILEMSELSFMDSTALHSLIRAKEALEARGMPLVLVGATDEPLRTLEATGLLRFFSTAVDLEHGLAMVDTTAASTA